MLQKLRTLRLYEYRPWLGDEWLSDFACTEINKHLNVCNISFASARSHLR
eukprot:EC720975.1.p3 GENE.EC720975.1~~EC720975.1.p3  ORF type:complete len:50 (-),score=2.88 EC720975.1:89-238(-)